MKSSLKFSLFLKKVSEFPLDSESSSDNIMASLQPQVVGLNVIKYVIGDSFNADNLIYRTLNWCLYLYDRKGLIYL